MDVGCGTSCWHPNWLTKFANTRWFMIVYGLLGTIQATSYLYFVITLTTIEKRFKIPSQTTGIILSGNEISQILLSLILTYFGGQRNRPRWIAWGVVFSALSCFILAMPHFLYGAGEEALQYTEEYLSAHQNASQVLSNPVDLKNNKLCKNTIKKLNECDEVFSYVPLVLIFLSQFVLGIGNTLYYSLGQSYLDDNTKQRNSPLMLSYAFSMRMVGPVIGFGLAYVMLRIYIDPTLTPIIAYNDPRWLGAWWLGWIALGALMFVFAGLIGMFPKHLPKKKKPIENTTEGAEKCNQKPEIDEKIEIKEKEGELKHFPKALMRLLRNDLLICNNVSTIFYILGSSGFFTFMGRVMEVQFNRTSAGGSLFTGPVTISGMVIGLLTSGYVITKYKPPPKYLFFWNVIIGLISVFAHLSYTQLGCQSNSSLIVNGTVVSCNVNCNCDGVTFTPVCDRLTGTTYFSPCHAGCTTFNETKEEYSNCTCSSPMSKIIEFQPISNKVINKRSTSTASFLVNELLMESTTNEIITRNKFMPTEKRITFYDVYDDELNPNKPSHDHDETIDANELYDVAYEDSQEDPLTHESDRIENLTRKRRQQQAEHIITPGACVGDCTFDYYAFSLIGMLSSLLNSTGRIGNILLNLRAVEPRDKAFSQGLSLFLASLFALIPGPIIFGRIIDSACLVWNFKCGRQGNCQLYDPMKFRYYLHSTASFFIFMGAFFDLLVWYKGRNLDLYGDLKDEKSNIEKERENDDTPESQPLNK